MSEPQRGSLSHWTALATAFALALVVLAAPGTSYASHDDFIEPDNADHYIDRVGLSTGSNDAVLHGINQLNRSDMNATLTGSGDVWVYDGWMGTSGDWNGTAGLTTCEFKTWNLARCDKFDVTFNQSYSNAYSAGQLDSLGCHELGHTGGLWHRYSTTDTDNNSCMRENISSIRPNFDNHDLDVINASI